MRAKDAAVYKETSMSNNKIQLGILLISTVLLALISIYAYQNHNPEAENKTGLDLRGAGIVELAQARELPQLTLESSTGHRVGTDELTGKWYLLYFGYTFCPDICPTSLAQMLQIKQLLAPHALEQIEFAMVTVDPQRDTPQQLRDYLKFFDPQFKGFSAEMEAIQSLSSALGIPFIPGDTTKPGYTVDHSGNLAIISPDGKHFGFIQAPFQIQKVAQQLNLLTQIAE